MSVCVFVCFRGWLQFILCKRSAVCGVKSKYLFVFCGGKKKECGQTRHTVFTVSPCLSPCLDFDYE